MFSGEWIDRIIGLVNVTVEVVMARAPTAATCSRWCASTRPPPGLKNWRYVRGPEGLIVELAERLDGTPG